MIESPLVTPLMPRTRVPLDVTPTLPSTPFTAIDLPPIAVTTDAEQRPAPRTYCTSMIVQTPAEIAGFLPLSRCLGDSAPSRTRGIEGWEVETPGLRRLRPSSDTYNTRTPRQTSAPN
jgi:hypothetical protein